MDGQNYVVFHAGTDNSYMNSSANFRGGDVGATFIDLFFAGYCFIVGAGIFSLMPHVIKFGQGLSWLSFVIGGVVCLITGLSYAKLNSLYPSNDAEYAWILNILNFDKDRDPKKIKTSVKYLANGAISCHPIHCYYDW